MKLLLLSDRESPYLWDYYQPGRLAPYDLILSCGDLKASYLSFVVTMARAPLLYVHGNHDEKYKHTPPEGCICIEDQIYVYKGVRILGLGGSMEYTSGDHQYTEKAMQKRVRKLRRQLFRNKGFDILVTHAPAFGLNDGEDLPHRGFQVFNTLIEKYNPKYFLHGHVHMRYGRKHVRFDTCGDTKVINAFERCVFEYEG